jgi:sugar-specific transcriptional regulator TrmB
MDLSILRDIGLSENEIKIYIYLLKSDAKTAYEIGKDTNMYRVHVYDKLEQLINKGLVSYIFKGAKKYFRAHSPSKLNDYFEDKKREIENESKKIKEIIPQLEAMTFLPKEDTNVEVFRGKEGLKYFLRDIIKIKQEVLISGIDDSKYEEAIPIFMKQYFRDIKNYKIKERVITIKKKNVFMFAKDTASNTEYRFLKEKQFNPTNTFIYGDRVVIVSWGTPITAIMIKNKEIAETYRGHFEQLWKIAKK